MDYQKKMQLNIIMLLGQFSSVSNLNLSDWPCPFLSRPCDWSNQFVMNIETFCSKRPLKECSTIVEEAKSIFGFDENHKLAYSQLFSQCFQHEVSC